MEVTKAVILAAGRGKRLAPLTDCTPKPLLPVAGRPLLEHILIGLRDAGLREFLCVIGHLGQQIQARFSDGRALGIRMEYCWQRDVHGTGAALRLGRAFAREGPVLMSFGDILTDYAHYRNLLSEYRRAPCAALMGINQMDDVSAGAAVLRRGDRVIGIVEKPRPGQIASNWNQAGVTIFGPEIWPVLEHLPISPRGEYEITAAISMLLDEGQEVRAVEFRGFWSDVGTPDALAAADRAWSVLPSETPAQPS